MNLRYVLLSILGFVVISMGCNYLIPPREWAIPIAMLLIGWWDAAIESFKEY
jgi:hypothetical protein